MTGIIHISRAKVSIRISGVYDSPDELLKEHHQEMSRVKAFLYRNWGRHMMNRNVRKIRVSRIEYGRYTHGKEKNTAKGF